MKHSTVSYNLVTLLAVLCVAISMTTNSVQAISKNNVHHIQNTDIRQCQLKKYLKKNAKGPIRSHADEIMRASRRYNVNPAFLAGIAKQEGGLGKTIYSGDRKNRNPGNIKTPKNILKSQDIGIRGYDESGHVKFKTWQGGWFGLAEVLNRDYIPYGRETAHDVVTHGYAEANQDGWAATVNETIDAIDRVHCK